MLSIKQLLYFTQIHRRSILDKAARCGVRIEAMEPMVDDWDQDCIYIKAIVVADTIPRTVEARVYGNSPDAKVWVTCNCEYFLYHCEVADEKKDSTDIFHSNGKKPRVTNPNMVPHICKHIAAMFLRNVTELKKLKYKKKYKR